MADISKIKLSDKTIYNIKDADARQKLPWCIIDSTSTSTAYTATVSGITKLENGVSFICRNNKVTSASGCTINVNGLGAKPIYMVTAAATRVTTQFAADTTWMLIYNETRVSGGCWDLVYLYNTNTTYSVFSNLTRGNAGYIAKSVIYRYQLCFQCDDEYITPLNNASNVTRTNKTMLTDVEFDPFGEIFYYATTTTINANARAAATSMCYAYASVDLRYSFNCGSTLTAYEPLYLKVSPQSNGKVKIANASPLTHTLPTTNDGYWYIFLGRTYGAYQISLYPYHPIYVFRDGKVIEIANSKPLSSFALDAYRRTNCNMVLFGDSWTVGGSASEASKRYSSLVCSRLNMTEYNFGVNAAGFTRSGNLFITQVETANNQMSDAEKANTGIVSVIGGVNDFRHRDDSGSEISLDDFSTAVLNCINRVHEVFPNALIVLGLSNSNLAWYTETMQHWMSYTARYVSTNVNYPILLIKNLAASVNGVTENYISDHLHLTDSGHSKFAAHVVNAILGGGQDVYYYIGDFVKNSNISSFDVIPHFFRDNNAVRLTAGYIRFKSNFKGNNIIATLPDMAIAPKINIYTPCFYKNRQIGNIAITTSGNIWFLEQPYNETKEIYHVSIPLFSAFPVTVSDTNITTTMRIVNCELSNPSAIIGNISWNTNTAGSLKLDGVINGSSSAEIDLIDTGTFSTDVIKEGIYVPETSWTFTGSENMT